MGKKNITIEDRSVKTNRLQENFELDATVQHQKYYQEGYREGVISTLHGEQYLEDLGIDNGRYSPGGARSISYEQGRKQAVIDCTPNAPIDESKFKKELLPEFLHATDQGNIFFMLEEDTEITELWLEYAKKHVKL